jgi:hypothetical protein
MLSLMPANIPRNAQLSRRDLFRLGILGTAGLGIPGRSNATANTTVNDGKPQHATAERCIYIFLCGGPSQLEMWDPKPDAPVQIRGPFGSIATNVPGIHIGELLPKVARQADKFAILRSMQIDTTSHDQGIFYTLLASRQASALKKAYPPQPHDHPGLGALLHKLLGAPGPLQPWAIVPRNFTLEDRYYKGQTGGFLGAAYDPFVLNAPKNDSLGRTAFELKGLDFGSGVDVTRFSSRRQLLGHLDSSTTNEPQSAAVRTMQEQYQQVFSLLTSSQTKEAFDVTCEPRKLREQYGMNEYGQSFLLARRLIERNVRVVNVFWTYYGKDGCQFNLWDNHGSDNATICGGASRGVDMLTHDYCCPSFDCAFSTLLEDLSQRGLLETTLVVVVGEFGRTPKVNNFAGRDHWGACYSAVMAGGGVQGGRIFGASDAHASYVKESPVSPYDLQATILHAFGFSPETAVSDQFDRPVRISDGLPVTALF